MKCFVANLFAEGVNGNGVENKSNACQWKADWTIKPVFYIQYPEKNQSVEIVSHGILLPKLFWPTVRKKF